MLTLYEELQLISIHEDKGIFIGFAADRLKPGLVGAILAELALTGKICSTNNHRLTVKDDSTTNDPILDEALHEIKESDKERKFGYWINNLTVKPEKLRRRITESLVQKGLLTQEDDNLVWIIPSPLHPEISASAKYAVVQHLRGIVLAKEQASLRAIAFLGLLNSCGLLELAFLRDERKIAYQYINELMIGEAMKDSMFETVQEIDSAIMGVVEED